MKVDQSRAAPGCEASGGQAAEVATWAGCQRENATAAMSATGHAGRSAASRRGRPPTAPPRASGQAMPAEAPDNEMICGSHSTATMPAPAVPWPGAAARYLAGSATWRARSELVDPLGVLCLAPVLALGLGTGLRPLLAAPVLTGTGVPARDRAVQQPVLAPPAGGRSAAALAGAVRNRVVRVVLCSPPQVMVQPDTTNLWWRPMNVAACSAS